MRGQSVERWLSKNGRRSDDRKPKIKPLNLFSKEIWTVAFDRSLENIDRN
jgi:hypothetical protein